MKGREAGSQEAGSRRAGARGIGGEYAVIRALLGPVLRTLPWRALAVAGALGLVFAGLPRLWSWESLPPLRAAALCLALGLAFLLDDPARHTTAAVPTRRPVRTGLRLALVAPVAALWWTAVLLLAPGRPPAGPVTLEAAALAALALAGAASAVRWSDAAEPGAATAAWLLFAASAGVLLLPGRWSLYVGPADPQWGAGHVRWAALLAVGVLVWAVAGPEPLRARRVTSVMHRRPARFGE
ncbi:ABC transporter [Streptomyces avermitilis]|uniref:ABC transporter n=1 Tax=Streptomyces avermitilis TaxID=33903 RepID=UPI0033CB19F1